MIRNISFYDFQIEDRIDIDAPPAAAFGFFEDMEANYTRWHPAHIRFEWRKGRGLAVGTEFFFEETIAGKRQAKLVTITEVEQDRCFAFVPKNPVFRFFLPRLWFAFEPRGGGCTFRAGIRLHGIGPFGRRLNRREFDAVEAHMAEEGRNLKALLEGAMQSPARR